MNLKALLSGLLQQNRSLAEQLLEVDTILDQIEHGDYWRCQDAITSLRGFCHYFESLGGHFREEEETLYRTAEATHPQLQAEVNELRSEHDLIRQRVERLRYQLTRFNVTGESAGLVALARQLLKLLRHHMTREEQVLSSALRQGLKPLA